MLKDAAGNAQFMTSELSGKTLYSSQVQSVNGSINILKKFNQWGLSAGSYCCNRKEIIYV